MRNAGPPLPAGLEALADLALDLRWTWSHAADELWRALDPRVWERTHNPWLALQQASSTRLQQLAEDAAFRGTLEAVVRERTQYLLRPGFHGGAQLQGERIAYFSMEFGLDEALALYAGGLGVLAGDYLKTASDLGLPVVGVGILFQEGYFRQSIDAAGQQHEAYPYTDPASLPIQPALTPQGWLRVSLALPGRTLWLRVWRAQVGRVPLYLLDANDPMNSPVDRGLTAKLYGGGMATRLKQELVLGIGGFRALEALGLVPTVAHLNEGHAAFAVLERARWAMRTHRLKFREALWETRAGNLFTTHTAVRDGFDLFPEAMMAKYFAAQTPALDEPPIDFGTLMALGRAEAAASDEPFNMAYLAIRGCARTNAVSAIHEQVSRRLFGRLYPRWPAQEVPIEHITNGVHFPSWDSRAADALWTGACGKQRWSGGIDQLSTGIAEVSDEQLWAMRNCERAELVAYANERVGEQLAHRGLAAQAVGLQPDVLTLAFARRFTEYKRANLLLHDPQRLLSLLTHPSRPVQLIIAGKAHPDDHKGKRVIAQWYAFLNHERVRRHVVFLEDYDIALATRLVAGVDVWINTPRRPFEACGTSGMKGLVNGVLNLSELDGWWAEAYAPMLGWALGGAADRESDDTRDADDLYRVLERELVPEFYDRDARGLPRGWLARMRASMSRLTPRFSSNRMLLEYAERMYAPAAAAHRERGAEGSSLARRLAAWQDCVESGFEHVQLRSPHASVRGNELEYRVTLKYGACAKQHLQVELYADADGDAPAFCQLMRETNACDDAQGTVYATTLTTSRPAYHFTPRVVARHASAQAAECPLIRWADTSALRVDFA